MSGHYDVRSFVYVTGKYNDGYENAGTHANRKVADAHAIFEGWAQDREVTRYLTWRPHERIEQTQQFVRTCIAAWESETRFPYMITLKEAGSVIGMVDPRIEGRKVGIGYGIACAHWGKGYVHEATRAILDWAFQQPSIQCVYATTDVENVASKRVLEKVGMQCEGILRKYIIHPNVSDIPRDSYIYTITR